MNYGRTFLAGVIGGAAMTAVITLVRVTGLMDVNQSMMVPTIHPLVPEQMLDPGIFMSYKGLMGVLAFLMLHALYGAIVGVMYHVMHMARTHGTTRHA
ncbi:MAG: hypothetical protein M3R24_28940 [Chloroflexota bacterium]|nr:hypothetical protein [Chloroflexota bacterium]